MSKFDEYFSRLDNYVFCMLVVKRMLDEKVITEEVYTLMEKEFAKEFCIKKRLMRGIFHKVDTNF